MRREHRHCAVAYYFLGGARLPKRGDALAFVGSQQDQVIRLLFQLVVEVSLLYSLLRNKLTVSKGCN